MDRNKMAPPSKTIRPKRPSTVSTASTSRKTLKDKNTNEIKARVNKNSILDNGVTIRKTDSMPDFDGEYRKYGKFLRGLLEDCLVDEKIEREETQMDIQMALLADRFQKTMNQLDKTNKRLKDINFIVEQKRLLDLKNQDYNTYNIKDDSNIEKSMEDLKITEGTYLDTLESNNIDFSYSQSGHKQLLDAVNDAIDGLDQIKKNSNLDDNKFKEFEKSFNDLDELENDRFDLTSLKSEFEIKFPKFSEKLLNNISEHIANVMDDNENNEDRV